MNYFLIISLLFSCFSYCGSAVSVLSFDESTAAASQDKEINKEITFERFTTQLPLTLQNEVISYLEPVDLEQRKEYVKQRDEQFRKALESFWDDPLEANNATCIKEVLRTEYFLRKYREEQLLQPQQACSDLCNIRNNHSLCVLGRAAGSRNSEIVALAVACGAKIDERQVITFPKYNDSTVYHDNDDQIIILGKTALEFAAHEKAFGICRFLLHFGASGKIYNEGLFTPLYYAIESDSVKAVTMFQDAGIILAQSKTWNTQESSLMYTAADQEAIQVIDYLAQQGEDLNWQDQFGRTPLMRAADMGYKKIIDKLLSLGADPSLKNKDGRTYEQLLEIHHWRNSFRELNLKRGGSRHR